MAITANFTYSAPYSRIIFHAGYQPGFDVTCVDTSSSDTPIVSWTWKKGNSLLTYSTSQSPGSTLGQASLGYPFSLTVRNSAAESDTKVIYIPLIFTDWGAAPVSESDAFELQFTDQSDPVSTVWDWDWGDSTSHGTTANPTHRYTAEGTYTATLTTDNGTLSKVLIIVDSTNPRVLLAGGYDRTIPHVNFGVIYRSTDVGATWSLVYSSFVNTNVISICSISDTILLAQTNTGNVLKSIDGGVNWSDLGTLISPTASGDLLYLGNNVVVALTGNDYIDRSIDGGDSWGQVSIQYLVDNSSTTTKGVALSAGRAVVTSDSDYGVLLSADYGLTWSLVASVDIVLKFRKFTDDIVVGLSYAGGGGWQNLLRSYDSGATWAIIDDDMITGSSYTGLGVTLPMGDVIFGRGPNGSATKCNYRQPYLSRSFLTATGTTSTPELFWSKNGKLFAFAATSVKRGIFVSDDRGQSFSVSLLSPIDPLHLFINTFAEVSAGPSVVADFTASLTSTYPNYVISFTDLSTGGPTTWYWDFGDGTTSTEQNPTKRYSHPGIYTVSLTADGSTETKDDYITINLVGIRQKTNYIYVIGKLKTWDYGPPPDRLLLRIAIGTGNGNTSSLIKGGGRASIPAQETDPVGTGFIRSNGPTIIFD